jgi:hypothetical protein
MNGWNGCLRKVFAPLAIISQSTMEIIGENGTKTKWKGQRRNEMKMKGPFILT